MNETNVPPNEQFMTPDQVCEWFQVKKDWLYDVTQRGEIPHVRIGRQLRYNRGELWDWLQTLRQNSTTPAEAADE
jgi:excisionase family DNA binding protein